MSEITGVKDFKDFVENTDIEFLKKIKLYVGNHNYIFNKPVDTSKFTDKKDWAKFFHYTIKTKSLYKKLQSGFIILNERDFFSIEEDKTADQGGSKRITKLRNKFKDYLLKYGYDEEEAEEISRYKWALEGRSFESVAI